jgi:hypothetical protein
MPLSEAFIRRFGNMTEKYTFFNGEVELRYKVKDHVYLLVTPHGLVAQDGVTSICHIIDKSEVLIPWGCKMMGQKLINDIPKAQLPTGEVVVLQQTLADFEIEVQKAKRAHEEKLEEAGAIGHTAHNWIEQYIKSVLKGDDSRKLELLANMPRDERASNACIAALDWMQRHNVRWISTERKIYSRQYRYAGTLDGLCQVDSCDDPQCCPHPFKDRLTVSDWKTSNYLYMEFLMQTAAYQQAYNEEQAYLAKLEHRAFTPVEDRWVIRVGKDDAKFEAWHLEADEFGDHFDCFQHALKLSRSVKRIQEIIKEKKDVARAEKKRVREAEKKAAEEKKIAEREEKKALAKVAKAAALSLACPGAAKYKGLKKPRCNKGNPCQSCLLKYAAVQAAKVTDVLKPQSVLDVLQ